MERDVKFGLLVGVLATSVGAVCVVLAVTDVLELGALTLRFLVSASALCGIGLVFTVSAVMRLISSRDFETG